MDAMRKEQFDAQMKACMLYPSPPLLPSQLTLITSHCVAAPLPSYCFSLKHTMQYTSTAQDIPRSQTLLRGLVRPARATAAHPGPGA
jgi:hypothetical protein